MLADLAKRRLRSKIPALTEALTGRFTEHHAFLARVHLDLIDQHTAAIDAITTRIEATIEPFHVVSRPDLHHPGHQHPDRRRHHRRDRWRHDPLPHRRSSGVVGRNHPGQQRVRRQSQVEPNTPRQPLPPRCARRRRHVVRPKSPAPTSAPGTAGSPNAADHRKPTSPSSTQCSSLSGTWEPMAAFYDDPGADYFNRLHPERAKKRAISQLEAMGYHVTLTHAS